MIRNLSIASFCLLLAGFCRAAVLFSDALDYTNGPLVTVSGSPWTTYSGTTGQVSVAGGKIFLNKANSEDVHAQLLGAPYSAVGGAVLYASFSLNVSNLPTSGGDYFAEFKGNGTVNQHGRIFMGTSGAGAGTYRLGVANAASAASAILTNNLATNTAYMVVLRYVVSNAVSTLWVNPSAETDAGVTAVDATSATDVSYFGLREPGSAIGNLSIDDVRVGTTFLDVTTNVVSSGQPATNGTLSLMTYNLNGNDVPDWSTNSVQVQAIGRQLKHLQPDIVAFNEIPYTNTYRMADWVAAYLPGYFLATNSVTDGSIRSGIASRFPITRQTSWLPHADLNPFGFTNANFTRDLYEAEIAVPDYPVPLHVFVAHLKATSTTTNTMQEDADRRAAEAAAISNFFATVYLPGTNGLHPYVLAGDMNEDIDRPATNYYTSGLPIQKLVSAPVGLRLTTPVNPLTGSELTESIRLPLDVRFDYLLPCSLLWSNIAYSQVFRSDTLNPLPANLLATDSATGSDHLPVLMYFRNPYAHVVRLQTGDLTTFGATLNWNTIPGERYSMESSTNLAAWSLLAANLTATNYSLTYPVSFSDENRFFRVRRQ